MKTILFSLVMMQMAAVALDEIKAKDGRVMKVRYAEASETGLVVEREDGMAFELKWDALDPAEKRKWLPWIYVKSEKDKFTDVTTFNLKKRMRLDNEVELAVEIYDKPDEKARTAILRWVRDGREWEWLSHHSVDLLIAGEKLHPASRISTAVISGSHVLEQVSIEVGIPLLKKIAEGAAFEARIGLKEFKLTADQAFIILLLLDVWTEAHTTPADPFKPTP